MLNICKRKYSLIRNNTKSNSHFSPEFNIFRITSNILLNGKLANELLQQWYHCAKKIIHNNIKQILRVNFKMPEINEVYFFIACYWVYLFQKLLLYEKSDVIHPLVTYGGFTSYCNKIGTLYSLLSEAVLWGLVFLCK